jgi:hypothetical protein
LKTYFEGFYRSECCTLMYNAKRAPKNVRKLFYVKKGKFGLPLLVMNKLWQEPLHLYCFNVYTDVCSFQCAGDKNNKGLQIVIDRVDKTVNLCECKYYTEPIEMTKSYADILNKRRALFRTYTGNKKNVFNTLICNQLPRKNDAHNQSIDRGVNLEEFF